MYWGLADGRAINKNHRFYPEYDAAHLLQCRHLFSGAFSKVDRPPSIRKHELMQAKTDCVRKQTLSMNYKDTGEIGDY